jgi:hypothetical protein
LYPTGETENLFSKFVSAVGRKRSCSHGSVILPQRSFETSFPGSGTLALLQWLPHTMEFWHFGDTDPEG